MLPQHFYRSWVEVDLHALRSNLAWIRHRVGPEVKIMGVVKADAYGHGLQQIAGTMMQSGVDVFGVANLTEAMAVHHTGAGWPVLMLGDALPFERPQMVASKIMPTISSVAEAKAFNQLASRMSIQLPVHVKIDTGMGRLGFWHEEAVEQILALRKCRSLQLHGIYSHFPAAENDVPFSEGQLQIFRQVVQRLENSGLFFPVKHIANSAGMLTVTNSFLDMVRPGLIMYGALPDPIPREFSRLTQNLQPVLSFKSRITLIRDFAPGRSVSYGRTYLVKRQMRVATVGVGYGDGFERSLSNKGEVLIRGRRCAVLGRVTMDQIMVDVTSVPGVKINDEVVLIGRQGKQQLLAGDVAQKAGSIPWEILTSITRRVPRVYFGTVSA